MRAVSAASCCRLRRCRLPLRLRRGAAPPRRAQGERVGEASIDAIGAVGGVDLPHFLYSRQTRPYAARILGMRTRL